MRPCRGPSTGQAPAPAMPAITIQAVRHVQPAITHVPLARGRPQPAGPAPPPPNVLYQPTPAHATRGI